MVHDVAAPSAHCLLECCAAAAPGTIADVMQSVAAWLLLLTAMQTSSYDIWTSLISSFLCDCTAAFGPRLSSKTSGLMLHPQLSNSYPSSLRDSVEWRMLPSLHQQPNCCC